MEQTLSLKGTRLYREVKDKNKPTVVLIHNMWGNHKILKRHKLLFQALGYNTVTFNLYRGSSLKDSSTFPFWYFFNFMYANWVLQIRDVLNSVDGPKIVFAMSGPSIAAIIACDNRKDITHLICDGGPFREIWSCTFRLFTQIAHVPTWPLRWVVTTAGVLQWGWHAYLHSQIVLNRWPKQRSILSIRGRKDPLVYPYNIDGIFKRHTTLNVRIWEISDGYHLDGLKRFSEEYRRTIEEFLK